MIEAFTMIDYDSLARYFVSICTGKFISEVWYSNGQGFIPELQLAKSRITVHF